MGVAKFVIRTLSLIFTVGSVFAQNAFESLHQIPQGWTFTRLGDGKTNIKLRISLKQQNVEEFIENFMDVSTPDHPKYGQHFEGHELRSLLKPTDETSSVVISWLQDFNITTIVDDGDYVLFETNVEAANKLMNTQFKWFRNAETGKEILRTLSYSVPKYVADHINFVQPTTRFGSLRHVFSTSEIIDDAERVEANVKSSSWTSSTGANAAGKINSACNLTITPQCLFNLYNIHYGASANCSNSIGYGSFLEEYARYSDLEAFEKKYAPYAIGQNFTVVSFNGGLNDQTSKGDSGEANLDQQYITGIGYPLPVTEFSTAGRGLLITDGDSPTQADNTNEPYLDFLLALLKLPNSQIPNSISISYGENEQEIPVSYAKQVCNLFAELGARGKTILFASGDSGTGSSCISNDGKNITRFNPIFPASCPNVTSVGGTRYIQPEVATFFSSGGFSDIWDRPSYQDNAVRSYLSKIGSKNAGYFNRNGRGFPDVAAQSQNYRVFDKGIEKGYRGTSCSAPTFNGVVALLNSARIASGRPTLGFLNPFIYSTGRHSLNDITLGASLGCNGFDRFNGLPNGTPAIPGASWEAAVGWDPVTGYGTPDFGKLLKVVAPGVLNTGGPA